jgi:hypothetical protein
MPLFFEKDNDIFFKDFGQVATRTDGATFTIIFEIKNDHEIFNPFSLSGEDLSAFCKVVDIQTHDIKKNDVITIDNVDYKITRVRKTNYSLGEIDLQYADD